MFQRSLSTSEFLAEASGVRITMTAPEEDSNQFVLTSSREEVILRIGSVGDNRENKKKSCGFHLTRSKWDPYPWVGSVEKDSIADKGGLRAGDCILDVSGRDIVGLRVKEIASLIQNDPQECVYIQVWRRSESPDHEDSAEGREGSGTALEGPLPEVARKLASAVSGAVRALECPVCLESAAPPVSQCVHGHILCVGCRPKTDRCPICRVRLGQGRCLLADKFHRTLQEAFNISDTDEKLSERLFGKRKKPTRDKDSNKSGGRGTVGPRQLLARLLLGGFDRAASAENLPSITRDESGGRQLIYRRLGELSSSDRAKSASTGELSKDFTTPDREFVNNSNPDVSAPRMGLLSVPQTPNWGGSTESISSAPLRCPLSNSTCCKEVLASGIVLEHLSRAHEGPQVHFHRGTATIPFPAPLGPNAVYILHHRGELFFFKCEDEAAWMLSTCSGDDWAWTLRGWGTDGTEVKLCRSVTTLEDTTPSSPLPHQIAPLPKALAIHMVEIKLKESRVGEALEM